MSYEAVPYVTTRMIPVACFQCGMPLSNKQQTYDNMVARGKSHAAALAHFGLDRACCRMNMMTAVDEPKLFRKLPMKESVAFPKTVISGAAARPYTLRADGRTVDMTVEDDEDGAGGTPQDAGKPM